MKERYREGYFVKSLAGHDKDKIYVIIREEKEYVYVADGKYHTLDKLKKKNKKHVQWINRSCETLVAELTNQEIVKAIKTEVLEDV